MRCRAVPFRTLKGAVVLLVYGFAAVNLHPADKGAASIKKGRALYSQHCRSCHGITGTGDGPAATSLKVPPADLTAISKKYNGFPSEKVMDWIDGVKYAVGHGSREMPVWGRRFGRADIASEMPGEVKALADYLRSIQKQ